MHSTNYRNTLIEVSPDCRAEVSLVPHKPGSVAALQYALIAGRPQGLTSDEVLVAVKGQREAVPQQEWAALAEEVFARPQACLRASPLVKTHGWGLYHDGQARVALVDRQSADYARLLADPAVTKLMGMRSKRA